MRTITVTAEDIATGITMAADSCPVARSLAREFGTHDVAVIGGDYLRVGIQMFTGAGNDVSRLEKFIADFDYGLPVEPTSFVIEPELQS